MNYKKKALATANGVRFDRSRLRQFQSQDSILKTSAKRESPLVRRRDRIGAITRWERLYHGQVAPVGHRSHTCADSANCANRQQGKCASPQACSRLLER